MKKRKILIFILIILIIIVLGLTAFKILYKKDEPNDYKSNYASVNPCLEVGNQCSIEEIRNGIKLNVEVKNNTYYDFYVISDTPEEMNLIMDKNLKDAVDWSVELVNFKGPNQVLEELHDLTNNWKNISYLNYEYKDYGKISYSETCSQGEDDYIDCDSELYPARGYLSLKLSEGNVNKIVYYMSDSDKVEYETNYYNEFRARLITLEEFSNLVSSGKVPWLIGNLDDNEGYWTLTSSVDKTVEYSLGAYAVVNENISIDNLGSLYTKKEYNKLNIGIRPVITLKK